MYSTGCTQRSGHFSNVYPKPGFERNMPSIHSAVPGNYGPNYRPSWGTNSSSMQNHYQVNKLNSLEVYEATNGFNKQQAGYSHEAGWGGTTPDQRVCYGECKRSGRMCASCVEYMQCNYGIQKLSGRSQSQMQTTPPYSQRHPSWHGGHTNHVVPSQRVPTHNGYPLQRSNSEPTGYGFNANYNHQQDQGSSPNWVAKSHAVDVNRRTATWYPNGFHQSTTHQGISLPDNSLQFKMNSYEMTNQRHKLQQTMRPPQSATSTMSTDRANVMTRPQNHFSSNQWNSPVAMSSMPNACASSMNSTQSVSQRNHDNRPESLQQHHGCAFPPTPPAEPTHYAMTGNKISNNTSCQLSQISQQPLMCSPTQQHSRESPYWNGATPTVSKRSVDGISKYQYCSQSDAMTSTGIASSTQSGNLQTQSAMNSPSACPNLPATCDLSDKAWQNDIADINTTGCEVNDKARIFSAELEKLAKLSQTFETDDFEFTNGATNTDIVSPSIKTIPSEMSCTSVVTSSISSTEKGTCFENTTRRVPYSPGQSEFTNLEQCLPCTPETNTRSVRVNSLNETDSQHGEKKLDETNSTTTSETPMDENGKPKTKHTDYLDQTSDVNPYGSQNCIAALSASCRKMIADMDKPEKNAATEQSSPKPSNTSQQGHNNNNNMNNYMDSTNGMVNCFNGPYGSMQQQQQQHQQPNQSFPVDPFTLHYSQLPLPNQIHGNPDKSRRGRKRKSTVGRGAGSVGNGRHYEHSDLTKRPANMITAQHSPHDSFGKDFDTSRSPVLNNSDTDLRNISPTFSDGPVSFDILDSVFSPGNSLDTSANDLTTILEGTNANGNFPHCNSFSNYETVLHPSSHPQSSSSPSHGGLTPIVTSSSSSHGSSVGANSQERHPLEILQDQIKIQRQQFSLDCSSDKLQEQNNNNSSTGELLFLFSENLFIK